MENRNIVVSPYIGSPKIVQSPHGLSIKDIIDNFYNTNDTPIEIRYYDFIVEVDGIPITRDKWNIVPEVNSHVLIYIPIHGGGGGKDILRTVAMIAVIVAAVATGQLYGASIAAGLGVTSTAGIATVTALTTAVIATAGSMLVNSLIPVRLDALGGGGSQSYNDSPTYSIQGSSNSARPFGVIPVVLGTHKVYPPYGATPYTEILGNDEYLRMLFIWGYGPLKIENICIGDTPIANYDDVEIETREGWDDDTDITLYPSTVTQTQIGVELKQADGQLVRSAEANVDVLSVDIVYPQGLVAFDSGGNKTQCTVQVKVEYREIGAGSWTEATTFNNIDSVSTPVRYGYKWNVDRTKSYEVALSRITADTDDSKIMDSVYWTVLRSFRNDHPINFSKPLAMTAIRIKASEQLQGVIDDLNATVSSYCPIWDGTAWVDLQVTSKNPAALARLTLMHPSNARARTESQIDNDTLGTWYDFCETNGYEFNMVRDFKSSVWECYADICSTARAAATVIDGKWSVIIDDATNPVVQHITPRNSWGFSSSKTLYNRPHAFRIAFTNEDEDYEKDELIVYDDDYNESNATIFESLEFPGVTNPDLIWKHGRYYIAQARLRPETYTLNMDFEHLICRRGSKVKVSHDIPLWGGGWGRVKELVIDEGDPTKTSGVVLDEKVVMEAGLLYVCRFRLNDSDGTSLSLSVENVPGETDTLTFLTSIPTTSGPQVDDLAMFGESTRETVELIVKNIERMDDFTARLELVDAAPAIYDADTGVIPPFNTYITKPLDITKIKPETPVINYVQSGTECLELFNGSVRPRIFVTITPISGNIKIGKFRVRYRQQGSTIWRFGETSNVDNRTVILADDIREGITYEFQAQSISIYGIESYWSILKTETVIGQTELPSDVENFAMNVLGINTHLSWDAVTDIDLSHYRVRWSPLTTGATWLSSTDMVLQVPKSATSCIVPTLSGSYLIKAVDYQGNESENASVIDTNVTRIQGFNFTLDLECPTWNGTEDGAIYDSDLGGIVLDSTGDVYLSFGYYTLNTTLDLEAVYTCRVTTSISVSGVDNSIDLYDSPDMYLINNLYGNIEGKYSASLEIRKTNDDPDSIPFWSEWKPFIIGDYTARAFQFRLKLTSVGANITPIVEHLTISLDMEDRIEKFNETIPNTGSTITFIPDFYVAPELAITIIDADEGDTVVVTNKSVSGFDIIIMNGGSGVEKEITGVAVAYGYKEED